MTLEAAEPTGWPIAKKTWDELVLANEQETWPETGVFGTGIGPKYRPGGILFVGKSAGPLGSRVGSNHAQAESVAASTKWMIDRRNRTSGFWIMAEKFDPSRLSLAWTNLCKMDRIGGKDPPSVRQWKSVAKVCIEAFRQEVTNLRPGVVILATSDFAADDVGKVLIRLGYRSSKTQLEDGLTRIYVNSHSYLVTTRHPIGWTTSARDKVVGLAKSLHQAALSGDLQ